MNEDFLHYLWQYQKFDKNELKTISGEPLTVLKTGIHNINSGPDFLEARIRIGSIDWVGNIEIHVKSSDWYRHNHDKDQAYNNVILHVVWSHDKLVLDQKGKEIPTLELQGLTPLVLRQRYKSLIESQTLIPCQNHFFQIEAINKLSMRERALMHRLERKSQELLSLLERNKGDWDETAFQLLTRNFGFKLNNEAFFRLAGLLPFRLLKKYENKLFQTEALFFGVAGFLEETPDDYSVQLRREFSFLSAKYMLSDKVMSANEWKFMRTRPSNFPTVRLAQLSALIAQNSGIFAALTEIDSVNTLENFLRTPTSAYWEKHYTFGKESKKMMQGLGEFSAQNLIVNTVTPLLAAYAKYTGNDVYMDRAVSLLETIPAEKNKITALWETLNFPVKTMADSQGSIELYNESCLKRKCLSCGIGVAILT
jgi:hypothetical protein